jgi:hypothetical protein
MARAFPLRERPFDFYSVIVAITIVTTPVATTIVAVIPTPVMVVVATVITVVMSSVAMIIIKVRHTASQQNSGGYRQQQGCCTLHSNFPNTKVLTTERLSLPAPSGRSARSR